MPAQAKEAGVVKSGIRLKAQGFLTASLLSGGLKLLGDSYSGRGQVVQGLYIVDVGCIAESKMCLVAHVTN